MRTVIKQSLKLILISVSLVAVVTWAFVYQPVRPANVQAVGDLTITYPGGSPPDPVFSVTNMLPGDVESEDVDVTNNASMPRPVAVRGVRTGGSDAIEEILEIVISEGGTDLYGGGSPGGPKTLKDFFDDSAGPNGVELSLLNAGDTTTYTFAVTFPTSAGDDYQGDSVVFNLIFGIGFEFPQECEGIVDPANAIFGTDGNDTIMGTRGNDLILGFEGNDKIYAHGGHDCIIGGPGNDNLRGETGNDVIFGNEGDDLVVGAVGDDLLFGNEGNDTIRGENNNDIIDAGAGDDKVTGGNGNDLINGQEGNDNISAENGNDVVLGGSGNDLLDGGAGNDEMDGEDGDDTLNGKAGNDNLIGGADTDFINGHSGTDTCDGETEVMCEL